MFVGCEWALAGSSGYCDLDVAGFLIPTQRLSAITFALELGSDEDQGVPALALTLGVDTLVYLPGSSTITLTDVALAALDAAVFSVG